MIDKLIAHSRTTEVASAVTLIMNSFRSAPIYNSFIDSLFLNIENQNNLLLNAINSTKVNSELDEKDELRDDKLRSLYCVLLGASHHPYSSISAAGKELLAIFEKYELTILRESYINESALINSLLLEFKDDSLKEYKESISGCDDLINEIEELQTNYDLVQTKYESDKAEYENQKSATKIKRALVQVINNKLTVYLEAMNQVDEKTFGSLTRSVARIISDNNTGVNKRKRSEPEEAIL